MVRGFNLPHQAGESPVTQPQSYFVTELFKTIIFPDRQLAARSGNRARRYLKRRIVLAAAMLLVTLTTLLLATVNFIDNLDLVRATTRDVAEAAKASPGAGANAEQTGQALGLLLQRVTKLDAASAGLQVPALWGLRSASALRDPTLGVYVARLRTMVDGPVREELTSNIRTIGDMVRADAENYENAYKDLRLYVMLVTAPDHLEPEWAANGIAEAWAGALRSDAQGAELATHARYYVDALATHPAWVWNPTKRSWVAPVASSRRSRSKRFSTGGCSAKPKGSPPSGPRKIFSRPVGSILRGTRRCDGARRLHQRGVAEGSRGARNHRREAAHRAVGLRRQGPEQNDAQRTSSAERQKEILSSATSEHGTTCSAASRSRHPATCAWPSTSCALSPKPTALTFASSAPSQKTPF